MKSTNIQWTHSTINPTSGCDGCELYRRPPASLTTVEEFRAWLQKQPCYAAQVHELRWAGSLAVSHPHLYGKHFYEVRTIAGRMTTAAGWGPVSDEDAAGKPWFTTRRRHIFVSDMSDALSRDVPFEFLKREIVDVVTGEKGRRHVWQWLTKRPQRMAEFDAWLASQGISWPENLWAGTSVTSQRTADARVPELLKVRAAVRFLSCEPLFEAVHLRRAAKGMAHIDGNVKLDGIHWVIVGGMSGVDAVPFDLDWVHSLRDQCKAAGVPLFVKQLGRRPVMTLHRASGQAEILRLPLKDAHGGDWSEWPADLRVRQMPEVSA